MINAERLKTEYYARRVIHQRDTEVVSTFPRKDDGSIKYSALDEKFGSGSGLMSQSDIVRRYENTEERLAEIEAIALEAGIELTIPGDE